MDDNTLTRRDKLPDWLGKMFAMIDKKDLAGAKAFLTEDLEMNFAHYQLKGADQFLEFVGGFDAQFSEYHHAIEQVWEGKNEVLFGGHLSMVIDDGTTVTTPFWNIVKKSPDDREKVAVFHAIFSMAAFPLKYWQHLSTKDLVK
jgi:hypothetical protein